MAKRIFAGLAALVVLVLFLYIFVIPGGWVPW